MRTAEVERNTNETKIRIELNLDGRGESETDTGIGFMDHMLTLFAKHGRFDLKAVCKGDTEVDFHHSTEDLGIALGTAFKQALGEKKGIVRYGSVTLPMDEALILSAVDLSGRCYLNYKVDIPAEKVGDFDTELVSEFFMGFARASESTIHLIQLDGFNSHHIIEAVFKSAARSLKQAVAFEPGFEEDTPSTKGVL